MSVVKSEDGKSFTQQQIDEKYSKLTDREHILKRPGMIIGEVKPNMDCVFTFDSVTEKITKKNVEYSPGFLKLFDEILTNAIDYSLEEASVTDIKITVDQKTGEMSVWNNGQGIPVMKHSEHNMYIPEMIFGHLRTGSNYDDSKLRAGGGMFGIGGKAVNIFSTRFTVETIDSVNKKKFIQTFSDNMSEKTVPKITSNSGKGYTKITWTPDYSRFEMKKGLDQDTFDLIHKRAIDSIVSTGPKVKLWFNGVQIVGKSLKDYVKYYIQDQPNDNESVNSSEVKRRVFYDTQTFKQSNGKHTIELVWEIAVVEGLSEGFEQVSFVNGLCTNQGGTHVKYITDKLVAKLKGLIEPKLKNKETFKPAMVKDKLFIFVKSTLVRPNFNSQTKEYLTTPVKDLGCYYEITDSFATKIIKGTSILTNILEYTSIKESMELKRKTDGSKKQKVFIPKLEDASYAGTSRSQECTLMLTEGDSGKTFAMRVRPNSDKFGVFALKGKVLNIRDATHAQLIGNEEINNLKQILGLEQNKVYNSKNIKDLRYGRIMMLTDADSDASHIRGLLINLFHSWWPSLLEPDLKFVCTLRTPIVKVRKGKLVKEFFTEQDYTKWENTREAKTSGWKIHYYKGLGTSTKEDAKNMLPRINELSLVYYHKDSKCDEAVRLAFEKDKNTKVKDTSSETVKYTDKRKEWLRHYKRDISVESHEKRISLYDMIHKELIHFSNYDNIRSIPNMMDGLKPSQRKIVYYMLKKNISSNVIKVAQLSGYVSAETSYHHGENSLQQAIIGLGQDFIGSNNYSLLVPEGNFGSRLRGGADAASPRYIFTRLSEFGMGIFDKRDSGILKYLMDDGQQIEPEFFMPIIPMILVNGTEGIGTGYSTFIPPFKLETIIDNLMQLLQFDEGLFKDQSQPEIKKMVPWYRNYKGVIVEDPTKPGVYITKGIYTCHGNTIKISELPIGTWITSYKEFLETLCDGYKPPKGEVNKNIKHPLCGLLKNVEYIKTDDENTDIQIVIEFLNKDNSNSDTLEKDLKLIKTISTNNMNLFDSSLTICKYNTPEEILIEYYDIRVEGYQKRKDLLVKVLKQDINVLENKIRFIQEYLNGKLKIAREKEENVVKQLETNDYQKVNDSFDYLLGMAIRTLTETKIIGMETECKNKKNQLEDLLSKSKYCLWMDDLQVIQNLIKD